MKKIKLFPVAVILFSTVLFYNCSSDSDNDKINQVAKNSVANKVENTANFLIIESDETPELTKETLELLGFSKLIIDSKQNSLIDLENNILTIPYNPYLSEYNFRKTDTYIDEGGIKIAKKNVKPGSGCSSCVDCIGFRCGTSSVTEITKFELESKIKLSQISNSREQSAYITIDTIKNTINFNFYNDIQWNDLK